MEVSEDGPRGEQSGFIYYEALDGAWMTVPQPIRVQILPRLVGKRPRRSRIAPCYYSDVFHDPEIVQAYADNAFSAGVTWLYGRATNRVAQKLIPRGVKVFLSLPYEPWSAVGDYADYLRDHPEIQAIDFKGRPRSHTVCPTYLLSHWSDFAPHLSRMIRGHLRSGEYSGVNWDVEQPVVDPPTFCTCDRCRQAFSIAAKVPLESVTPESLLDQYRSAFVDFRCRQNAEAAGRIRKLVQSIRPGIEFSLYTGYHGTRTREHYGVDWHLMAPHLDFGIAGYGGDRTAVSATVRALGKVPFMGGEMYYLSPYADTQPPPNPLTWRNRLLRQYLESGAHGVLIWYLPVMDGGAFYFTSETAEIIAREEDFLSQAARDDTDWVVQGLPEMDWFAFKNGDETRLYLLNMDDTRCDIHITPGTTPKSRSARLYGRGATLMSESKDLSIRLERYGCAVLQVRSR